MGSNSCKRCGESIDMDSDASLKFPGYCCTCSDEAYQQHRAVFEQDTRTHTRTVDVSKFPSTELDTDIVTADYSSYDDLNSLLGVPDAVDAPDVDHCVRVATQIFRDWQTCVSVTIRQDGLTITFDRSDLSADDAVPPINAPPEKSPEWYDPLAKTDARYR